MSSLPTVAHVAIPRGVELPPGSEGDNWALLLSELSLHTSLTIERRLGGHWINLHSKRLRFLLGGQYRKRLNAMRDSGVIEINNGYSIGTENASPFTKSYRLAASYRTGQSHLHKLTTRPTIRKAVKSHDPDPNNLGAAGMHYRSCFDRFVLDSVAVEDPLLASHWDKRTIARWLNREEFAHRCEFRRFHSLMSQLPRRARQYLWTVDCQPVCMVDVSACQPLLLGYLAACHHRHPSSMPPPSPSTICRTFFRRQSVQVGQRCGLLDRAVRDEDDLPIPLEHNSIIRWSDNHDPDDNNREAS